MEVFQNTEKGRGSSYELQTVEHKEGIKEEPLKLWSVLPVKSTLIKIIKASVQILACEDECGGLWFSHSQVERLKNIRPESGMSLLMIKRVDGIKVYRRVEHICPQCKTTLLFRHFFSKELDTEVNQCAKCGGFWVDAAGLSKLRSMTGQQKQIAMDSYFSIILHKKISSIHLLNEDVNQAVKSIIQIFKFLCPEEDFPETSGL